MKILLITAFYPPEVRSASNLMLELAEELKGRTHEVTVITTWPEYNLPEKQKEMNYETVMVENGITIIRVRTYPRYNVSYVRRGISELIMPLQFILKLRRVKISPDVAVAYSPPLLLTLVGVWCRFKRIRYILNIQDLFPQNAIDIGVLKNPLLIWMYRIFESMAYCLANKITVHSSGNKDQLLDRSPRLKEKMAVVHNWVDIAHHDEESKEVNFRERYGVNNKKIALFAGVMGPSQHLDLVLHIAEKLSDRREWHFLFVGDGSEKSRLREIAGSKKLENVSFEEFISRDEYPDLLKICSCGLVCLSPLNKTPVVPGKILGYMAASLPVVAFLHPGSDGHKVIFDSGCGISVDSGDINACEVAMSQIMDNKTTLSTLASSGRKYVERNFSKQVCIDEMEKLFTP